MVEDDHGLRHLIEKTLERAEFQTASASDGAEAVSKVAGDDGMLLLLDYQLPDMTGKDVVEIVGDGPPRSFRDDDGSG